ncbi:hypothetical protein YC2023_028042 [Brassica napus]
MGIILDSVIKSPEPEKKRNPKSVVPPTSGAHSRSRRSLFPPSSLLFLPGEMRRLLVYGGDSCLRSDRGGAELGRRKSEAGTTASRSKWYS